MVMGYQRKAAALHLNTLFGHAQADTRALDGALAFGGALEEWFKHACYILGWNRGAGVGDVDNKVSIFSAPHNVDFSAVRSIIDGVGQSRICSNIFLLILDF